MHLRLFRRDAFGPAHLGWSCAELVLAADDRRTQPCTATVAPGTSALVRAPRLVGLPTIGATLVGRQLPAAGTVWVEETDLHDLPVAEARTKLRLLDSEPYLFSRSVRDNLLLGARGAEGRPLEGRVVEASIQLDDTTLTAPYDGVIAQRFVEEGQNVRAKDPVVRFQDVEEIEIVVDVPETVMTADIRSADIVSLVAEVSGAPGVEFPVEIREIAQVADPTTQTFKVRTAMKAPEPSEICPQ